MSDAPRTHTCAACGHEYAIRQGVCPQCGHMTVWFTLRLGIGCVSVAVALLGILAMLVMALAAD